jgi:hypothetical protein
MAAPIVTLKRLAGSVASKHVDAKSDAGGSYCRHI